MRNPDDNGDREKGQRSSRSEPSPSRRGLPDYDAAGDALLLERLGRADIVALGVLYRRHAPRLYTALLRLEEGAEGADELLCAVFLDVWRRYAWPVNGQGVSPQSAVDDATVRVMVGAAGGRGNGRPVSEVQVRETLATCRDGEQTRPPVAVRRRLMRRLGHPEVDREARRSGVAARAVTGLALLAAVSLTVLTGWWLLQ